MRRRMMRKKNLIILKFDMTTETEDINLLIRSGYPIRHRLKHLKFRLKGGKPGGDTDMVCNNVEQPFYKVGDHWTLKKDRHGYYCEKDKWADHIDDRNIKLDCCLGSVNDSQICAPDWIPGHFSCRESIQEYCMSGDNMVTEDICRNFCGHNDNKEWCDQMMRAYCQNPEHRGLEICSCIVSATPHPGCFDPICMSKGYLTGDQLNELDRCDQVCSQVADCYRNGRCQVDINSFERSCPHLQLPPRQSLPRGQRRTLQSSTAGMSSHLFLWLSILVIFIIAIIIGYFIINRNRTKSAQLQG